MGLTQRSDPSLLVMVSLADGPKHGYALSKDIMQFSGVALGPGTLYGCITRLEARGLIEALPAEDRRTPYRLTAEFGGIGGFFVALFVAIRRVAASTTFLVTEIRIGRFIGCLCGLSAASSGIAGVLLVRAAFVPGEAQIGTSLPWWWWPCIAPLLALSAGQLVRTVRPGDAACSPSS